MLDRRTALLGQVKADLDGFDKVWTRRVGGVAQHATTGTPVPGLEKSEAAHAELISRLKKTQSASQALQLEEHAMGLRLAAWRKELEEIS